MSINDAGDLPETDKSGVLTELFRRYIQCPRPRWNIVSHLGSEGIRCHGCNRISYHPADIENRYCPCLGLRHEFLELIEDCGAIKVQYDEGPDA